MWYLWIFKKKWSEKWLWNWLPISGGCGSWGISSDLPFTNHTQWPKYQSTQKSMHHAGTSDISDCYKISVNSDPIIVIVGTYELSFAQKWMHICGWDNQRWRGHWNPTYNNLIQLKCLCWGMWGHTTPPCALLPEHEPSYPLHNSNMFSLQKLAKFTWSWSDSLTSKVWGLIA